MNSVKKMTIFLVPVLLLGCATRPSSIEPLVVSDTSYEGLSCKQLVSGINEKYKELAVYSKAQNSKATSDIVTSTLLLVPGSLFTGNYEEEIAQLKGDVIAINHNLQKKQCDTSNVVPEPDVSDLKVEDFKKPEDKN